ALVAFDANSLRLLWSSDTNAARDAVGNFGKFCPPVVANGHVYLCTFSNALRVYGLQGGSGGTGSGGAAGAGGTGSAGAAGAGGAAGSGGSPAGSVAVGGGRAVARSTKGRGPCVRAGRAGEQG